MPAPNPEPKPVGPTAEDYLRILVGVMGRVAMPERRLREIVSPTRSAKYVAAYNACNGTRTLTEVARTASVDLGNLSRAANRWVTAGVAFKLGPANQPMLLHLYPLSDSAEGADDGEQEARPSGNGSAGRRAPRAARSTTPARPTEENSAPGDTARQPKGRTAENRPGAPSTPQAAGEVSA